MFETISKHLRQAKKMVFVTGAGISQESNIPTFRGKDGYWKKHDPMKLATINAFNKDPRLVWEWYEDRRRNIRFAIPNPGHNAISELEKFYKITILTQNIDGLHQKAGSSKVLELHGSIIRIKCTVCDFQDYIISDFQELPPKCNCGNILRPDVIWFGESLPQDIWKDAIQKARLCDVMIIVGTSLVVSPANTLPIFAKQNNAVLIEVNPQETEMSNKMDISIRDTASNVLPQLVEFVKHLKY